MRTHSSIVWLVLMSPLVIHPGLFADETPVKSRISAAALFKNGLAVITRTVPITGPGTYRLDEVPEPVHGTYWVQSTVPVESSIQQRSVDVPLDLTAANLAEAFAGHKVTLFFRQDKLAPLTGTVFPPSRKHAALDPRSPRRFGFEASAAPETEPASPFLMLQTAKGRAFVQLQDVAYYEVEGQGSFDAVKRRRPVLLLTVSATDKLAAPILISYLAHGLAWAPSYRVDTTDAKQLSIEQTAVVRNELEDLAGAEVTLISGFPSIQFAHVTSPLAAQTSWNLFFQQLSQRPAALHASLGNPVMQQAVFPGYGSQGAPVTVLPGREGVDLYYHPIGKRTLARNESLLLVTAKGQAAYERIVEWLIPDTRDESGNYVQQRPGGEDPDEADDVAWDALKFRNPLAFPMTTGPALVMAQGRFNGQRLTGWVNAGEETSLRVTKALSVRTRAVEHEEQKGPGVSERDLIYIGGRRFRQATVAGELKLCNHRSQPIQLRVRRRFSGDLLRADGQPRIELREEGVFSVNKRNELTWTFALKPGEEKTLSYRYSVLVSF